MRTKSTIRLGAFFDAEVFWVSVWIDAPEKENNSEPEI